MQVLTWPPENEGAAIRLSRSLECVCRSRCLSYICARCDLKLQLPEYFHLNKTGRCWCISLLHKHNKHTPYLFFSVSNIFFNLLSSLLEGGVQVLTAVDNLSRFVLIRIWAAAPLIRPCLETSRLPLPILHTATSVLTPTFPCSERTSQVTDKINWFNLFVHFYRITSISKLSLRFGLSLRLILADVNQTPFSVFLSHTKWA